MRVFKGFNGSDGIVCPVCHTSKNVETVLVPIPGTESGNNIEAVQVHKKCYDLFIEMTDSDDIQQEME